MLAEGGDDNEAEAESAEVAKRKRAERQRLAAARERKKKVGGIVDQAHSTTNFSCTDSHYMSLLRDYDY